MITQNINGTENGHSFVDLGLPSGLLWATCNVGASNPEDTGLYFAWGETTGFTAEQVTGGERAFSKEEYNTGPAVSILAELTLEQDAAHVNMGGKWRMPTKDEFEELIKNCISTWVANYLNKGVTGRLFTSKITGNSVFFPAAGYCNGSSVSRVGSGGYYWSASWRSASDAWRLDFFSGEVLTYDFNRNLGLSVRGVCERL